MKTGLKFMLMLVIALPLAFAQQAPTQPRPVVSAKDVARTNLVERVDAPTDSDIYCSGFLSPTPLSATSKIAERRS